MRLTSIELRQYTMRSGRMDDFVALFEREFVATQESAGIRLIGLFRDADDPDRFVWLRGYPTPEARRPALEAFYDSEHWKTHRAAANACMVSSDDVLVLRPLMSASAPRVGDARPAGASGAVVVGVHRLLGADDPLQTRFMATNAPALENAGLAPLAVMVTDDAPNAFPRHPIREGEKVLVWFAAVADLIQGRLAVETARADPDLAPMFKAASQVLLLCPTPSSPLGGS